MTHRTFSRRGGKASSPRKTIANRAKAKLFWKAVRAGTRPAPCRPRVPPPPEEVARLLAPFCRRQGVTRLEIFGSAARNEARRGSDLDLLVSFKRTPGLRFFAMSGEMSRLVGVPVHLLTRAAVEQMSNRIRRDSILAGARIIYAA